MRCPCLAELPPPPPGKTGWPWIQETAQLPDTMPDGATWPKISIVTPSYNQGQFIEETIRSVLLQGYADLEYILIDGGSNDGTLEVMEKYRRWLAYGVSEKDHGQSHALNKGFHRATGQLVGWQNSDDYYGPGALGPLAVVATQHPDADIFHGTSYFTDVQRQTQHKIFTERFDLAVEAVTFPLFQFSNQAMFFSRRIFERGQFIDETYHHAMDTEFVVRLILAGCRFQFVPGLAGTCRLHDAAKTVYQADVSGRESLVLCIKAFASGKLPAPVQQRALQGFRRVLLGLFRNGQTREFRRGVGELVRYGGWRALDAKLLARYLVSYTGGSATRRLLGVLRAAPARCQVPSAGGSSP